MDGLTTKEAFKKLIDERGFHKKIPGLSESTGRSLRKYFNDGKITIDRMEEILLKAGFNVIQEKLWGN
ncbi:hypothetical protein KHS38_11775 [Mucilaginibacter sp. Bleaf8]|uniref:hypothetical protein n=1 Tax=Mucilaginibacter sp. Bleaf8 TaxID=2834430 RepID=UPI001BD1301A|nr:hypothetical protein [Mucilaginibacter sp. Bleaf8]MBS7565084.1 hypothetical protein [Mucilaginibacter sp. Bleaf8]